MIDRRNLVGVFLVAAFATPFGADAQSTEKVRRIGFIGIAPPGVSPESERQLDIFMRALREHGFVEGKNIVLDRRAMEGRNDRARPLVDELIGLPVDVLVVNGTYVTRTAKEMTTTIPIVVLNAADPVGSGLVASLSRPGGNITGMTNFGEDLYAKRLELLKAAVPRANRVAFVQGDNRLNLDAAASDAIKREREAAARALGLSILTIAMMTPQDFAVVTATLMRERVDAVLWEGTQAAYFVRKEIGDFGIRQRMPVMVADSAAGTGGALMSYGADLDDNWRKLAIYVAKIFNGATPADLPMERPTTVKLVINLKTAKAIGVTIPQALLVRADEVIQ
jgi:putative ABC transport system substrate-binding protein